MVSTLWLFVVIFSFSKNWFRVVFFPGDSWNPQKQNGSMAAVAVTSISELIPQANDTASGPWGKIFKAYEPHLVTVISPQISQAFGLYNLTGKMILAHHFCAT